QIPDYSIQSVPENCMLPHVSMGMNLNPGEYEVTLNKEHTYTVLHTLDSLRSTGRLLVEGAATVGLPIIEFQGCSFTYGMGVDDEDTYPFILQQQFPNLIIKNYAKPGYGQVQALKHLVQSIEDKKQPDYFILNYLSFHDERNSMNKNYRQKIKMGYDMYLKNNSIVGENQYNYPYASISNRVLQLKKVAIKSIYDHFPLRDKLTTVNLIENSYNRFQINEDQDDVITKKLLEKINTLCLQNGVKLVVTYMEKNIPTKEVITYCESLEIATIDITVDFNDHVYTNYPLDPHPSPLAHQVFAEKLLGYFNSIGD
ncbi:MAG: hypothetical protein HRT73_12445, partial [Flavobacteriales bacterium]|nr:hypothetical protein [Flavobacteriales bacterium]